MTTKEAIHFANCLKNNWTIDFADMEEFCDMAIRALGGDPWNDAILNPPKRGGEYLIYVPDHNGESIVSEAAYEKWREMWVDPYEGYVKYSPTHWMNKPKPPKGA